MRAIALALGVAACGPREIACAVQESSATATGCGLESGCCSFAWDTCEDGVSYDVVCDSRTLPTQCDCVEDGQIVETFSPEGYSCPPNFEEPRIETIRPLANDACGWGLQ